MRIDLTKMLVVLTLIPADIYLLFQIMFIRFLKILHVLIVFALISLIRFLLLDICQMISLNFITCSIVLSSIANLYLTNFFDITSDCGFSVEIIVLYLASVILNLNSSRCKSSWLSGINAVSSGFYGFLSHSTSYLLSF